MFVHRQYWLLAVSCVVLLLLDRYTSLDQWLSDRFFDSRSGRFPLRHHWLFEDVLHDGGRYLVFAVAIGILIVLVWALATHRRKLVVVTRFLLLSMVITTSTVAVIKYLSPVHCPIHLVRYGGEYLMSQPEGRCWPGGHASAAFSLLAFFYATRKFCPARAWWILAAVLALGAVFSLAQTVRGSHFISHNLWTAWIAWLVNLLLLPLLNFHSRTGQSAAA